MQHQELILGLDGQTLRFDPPDGRPAAEPVPTVVVHQGVRIMPATTGACSIDPVDTRLHGDAYRGSTNICVTSVEGIAVGGRYLMTKPEGEREWIQIIEIADHTLSLRHPLIHRYAGAATIQGCRISIAVNLTWVSTRAWLTDTGTHQGLAAYTVNWSYVSNGIEVTGVSFADVVPVASSQLVTPEDVDLRNPGWIAALPPAHRENQGTDFISEAFRVIRLEAVGDAHAQRKIRDAQILRELVQARAQVIQLEQKVMYGERRTDELAVAEARYRRRYDQLVMPMQDFVPASELPPTQDQLARLRAKRRS